MTESRSDQETQPNQQPQSQSPLDGAEHQAHSRVTAIGRAEPEQAHCNPTIPDVDIESELGRGGMGVVYRGRQSYLGRTVAVKVLRAGLGDSEYAARFRREATILAGLSHPHIVACYQAGVAPDGACYLVMEYIDGPNVWQYVKEHGPLSPQVTLRLIRDMALALQYAHERGIIHRDVKAENILLASVAASAASVDGGSFQSKLVDLGLAKPNSQGPADNALTRQGTIMGTPATMAPEQFDDPDGVDYRADMYGLGCAAYQALTGKAAFSGTSLVDIMAAKAQGMVPDPRQFNATCPSGLADIITRLLKPKRDDRYPDYTALVTACDAIQSLPAVSSMARRPPLVGVIGIAAVLCGGAVWWYQSAVAADPVAQVGSQTVTIGADVQKLVPGELPSAPVVQASTSPSQPSGPGPATVSPPVETVVRPIDWAPATSLVPTLRDFRTIWQGDAGWGLDEERDGLTGSTAGRSDIQYVVSSETWRAEGVVALAGQAPLGKAGVWVQARNGDRIDATCVQLSGSTFVLVQVRRGDAVERLGFTPVTTAAPWTWQVETRGTEVAITLAGDQRRIPFGPAVILGLSVEGGAVYVPTLSVSEPLVPAGG